MPSALAGLLPRIALICLISLMGGACSSSQLDESARNQARLDLEGRLAAAGFEIDVSTTECAVGQLDQPTAVALASDDFGGEEAQLVAEVLVDCDDAPIGLGAVLRPLAPEASAPSLDCAAGELGDAMLSDLLAAELSGSDVVRSADELDVTTALSLCLTPEELLELHR